MSVASVALGAASFSDTALKTRRCSVFIRKLPQLAVNGDKGGFQTPGADSGGPPHQNHQLMSSSLLPGEDRAGEARQGCFRQINDVSDMKEQAPVLAPAQPQPNDLLL